MSCLFGIEIPVEPQKSEKMLHNTVVIADRFAERRSQQPSRPAEDTPQEALKPGDRLGRYVLLAQLGGGGMGMVYKAHDTELNRTVALKVLPPHLCRNPDYLQRFRAEAQAHARLNSPQIVTLFSLMEVPAGEVLVLEYVDGQTLAQRLRNLGPLPISEAVELFARALAGVEHIHRMGVVHRDLKPSNIFLANDGRVKLMDFGVAKLMDQHDASHSGTMVGTLLYISPEQINGRETDFRSDIYTLGISLYEAVTGRLPFERRSDYALMHAHVQETPPRPKDFLRRIPTSLEWVILKAIEKDPERRFQSAAEFRSALLKLGLIERRNRATSGDAALPALVDHAALEQELRRYRLLPSNRLLSGLGFDVLLIGAVIALAWGLGILPPGKTTTTTVATTSTKTPNQAGAKAATAKPKESRARTADTGAKKTAPSKDQYDALRKAWGG